MYSFLVTMGKEKIPVCIVDEHHDVVPFLFALIRSGKLPFPPKGITLPASSPEVILVHIDAHPDLQPPSFSSSSSSECTDSFMSVVPSFARTVQDSHSFLEQLYSSSGAISEFILPLLYNRYLTSMIWIRSPWSNQLDDGKYRFIIGDTAHDGSAAVTLPAPYYFDEGIVYTADELDDVNRVEVNVLVRTIDKNDYSDLDDDNGSDVDNNNCGENVHRGVHGITPSSSSSRMWILDVCLDFFSTINPFYLEMKDLFAAEGLPEESIDVLKTVCSSLAYRASDTQTNLTNLERREQRQSMEEMLQTLVEGNIFLLSVSFVFCVTLSPNFFTLPKIQMREDTVACRFFLLKLKYLIFS